MYAQSEVNFNTVKVPNGTFNNIMVSFESPVMVSFESTAMVSSHDRYVTSNILQSFTYSSFRNEVFAPYGLLADSRRSAQFC